MFKKFCEWWVKTAVQLVIGFAVLALIVMTVAAVTLIITTFGAVSFFSAIGVILGVFTLVAIAVTFNTKEAGEDE